MPYVFLLFILMPIVEIAVLIQVGGSIGLFPTLLIIILTAILGTYLLRQQGLATLTRARQRMSSGQLPAEQMMEGVLLLIGGVLLLTPGFVTDAFGFSCLFPLTRQWMARKMASRSVIGVMGMGGGGPGTSAGMGPDSGSGADGSFGGTSGATPGGKPARKPIDGEVIEGSYRREDS